MILSGIGRDGVRGNRGRLFPVACYDSGMEQIAVTKFKANCVAVLKKVQKTGKPVTITRFGEPVAEVVPLRAPKRSARRLGAMAGRGRIVGDIVAPAVDWREWDALTK